MKPKEKIDRRAARYGFAQGYAVADRAGVIHGTFAQRDVALALASMHRGWAVFVVLAKEVGRAAA
jgi:hypothetical protein